MEKREYITPYVKIVNMETIYMLAATNREFLGKFGESDSRKANVWEDDDEEEDTGGWFK